MTNKELKTKLNQLKKNRKEKEEKLKLEKEIKKEERKGSSFWRVVDLLVEASQERKK